MYELAGRVDRRRILTTIRILRAEPAADLSGVDVIGLVDTGATSSGITPRVVERLGLESYGKRPLGSARGEEQTPRYIFRIGLVPEPGNEPIFPFVCDIDGFELRNSFQFDALIGMDVLGQCDLFVRRNGMWSLRFGT